MRDLTLPALDRTPLAATLFQPPAGSPSSRVAIVSPAAGVGRDFYAGFARHLAGRGFTALTFDFRGVGGSRPERLRGYRARMRDWGQLDLPGVVAWARGRFGRRPLALVGHSAGGQMIGLSEAGLDVDSFLAVGAQSGYWRLWPRPWRYRAVLSWRLMAPALSRICGYFPGRAVGFFCDLPKGVALEMARWCSHPDYLVDEAGRPLPTLFDQIRAPILSLAFTDDLFAPPRAVEALIRRFRRAPLESLTIQPDEIGLRRIGHFRFFKPGRTPALWRRAVAWLTDPPAPSIEGTTGGRAATAPLHPELRPRREARG